MDKLSYALSLGIGQQLKQMGLKDVLKVEDFSQSIIDVLTDADLKVSHAEGQKIVNDFFQKLEDVKRAEAAEAGKAAKADGEKFLAENAKKEGVVTTPSGLQYKILTKGTGPVPTASQEVKVKYEGKLLDGTVFDSSYKRSDPITKFRCNQVIKGWTEALTMMPVGSTWELYIPYELAYGDADQGKIKPYSMLIFKVELIGIEGLEAEKPAEPVKAAPVKAAPKKVAKKK